MREDDSKDIQLWGGIECTINRVGNDFFDQLQYSGHYTRASDIDALAKTGITKLRYPILWERHQPGQNSSIDWSETSAKLLSIREKNIDVIVGLVHHGSGPAYTDLADENFPYLLAAYAKEVATKFPWIQYYTPVNEPLTTARFSGLYGLWYPHKKDDYSFLRMLLHQVKGIVLSMKAIREVNPSAQLVQTEDLGKTYSGKSLQYQADFENHRRWLTYDLLCGRVNKKHPLWKYFLKKGIKAEELSFFQNNVCIPDVFGFNHYLTSERFLDGRYNRYPKHTHGGNGHHRYADVEAARIPLKAEWGVKTLLKEAWQRYKKPIAVTEVHLHCHREDQLRWFKHVWNACKELRTEGVDIKAATAWAILGSYGWNKLLTQPNGDYEAGVFDVRNGTLRTTALSNFISTLGKDSHLQLLSDGKGWWQRADRFFHRPLSIQTNVEHLPEAGAPILIIGKNGTLGRAFAKVCKQRCLAYKLVSRQECDICDETSINHAIETYKPWAIINAAGFVRVDDAEEESFQCYEDNTRGPLLLAKAANKYGLKLVSFSTDLVFDGKKSTAYVEEDAINPLNVYGRTKAEAERTVLLENSSALMIRTSAFFGPWDEYNFAHYVRRSLVNGEVITVAKDITISPTYVPDLANAVLDLVVDGEKGIWHIANQGEVTWADFAHEVANRFRLKKIYINSVSKEELHYPAKRPSYTVLSSSRGIMLPTLEDALRRFTSDAKWIQRENIEFRA